MWPVARILAHDRRRAAVHEAGHLVIGRHCGLKDSYALIFPNPDWSTDDLGENLAWRGKTSFSSNELQRLSDVRRHMIGTAGAIAELAWEGADVDTEEYFMDPAAMSASDWALAGCAPGKMERKALRAAEKVMGLLRRDTGPLWPNLCIAAASLIGTHKRLVDQKRPA